MQWDLSLRRPWVAGGSPEGTTHTPLAVARIQPRDLRYYAYKLMSQRSICNEAGTLLHILPGIVETILYSPLGYTFVHSGMHLGDDELADAVFAPRGYGWRTPAQMAYVIALEQTAALWARAIHLPTPDTPHEQALVIVTQEECDARYRQLIEALSHPLELATEEDLLGL
jgi:hypothetical protein